MGTTLASSATIPSNRLITRSARLATRASWVTSRIAWPPACVRRSSRSTSRVLALSRLPVGSSASSRLGSLASARASATRCCSPPDSRAGAAPALSVMPSSASSSSRRLPAPAAAVAPASSAGSSTLSATVIVDSRLKNWNTKPTCRRRRTAQVGRGQPVDPLAAQPDLAAGGGLEAAENVQQGGLARAGRPHDGDELADGELDVHPADGLHRDAVGPVDLHELGVRSCCADLAEPATAGPRPRAAPAGR